MFATEQQKAQFIQNVQDFISTADDETLTALETTISTARGARLATRDAALPDYPVLVSTDAPGHKAGNFVQVNKAKAVELLTAGSHRLPTDAELAAYTGQSA